MKSQNSSTNSLQDYAARSALVPIMWSIDAEPDGFFVDPHKPEPWRGLERALTELAPVRERIAQATGAPPRNCWMVRTDPQIAVTYGSASWPLEHYRDIFAALTSMGDEIGLHVHTYRPTPRGDGWIVECADPDWIEHCVRSSVAAYTDSLGLRPRVFSIGVHWMSNEVRSLLEELGIEIDHTLMPGQPGRPISDFFTHEGEARGMFPDYLSVPRRPFRPSKHDFRVEDASRTEGLWMLPTTAVPLGIRLPWRKRLRSFAKSLIGRGRAALTPLALRNGPVELREGFNRILYEAERPHFVFEMRCSVFDAPPVWRRVQESLDFILSHPEARRFRFVTPHKLLQMLGCVPNEAMEQAAMKAVA